jgi:hypothetical protein
MLSRSQIPRIFGVVVLAFILTRVDLGRLGDTLAGANFGLVALAIAGNIPGLAIKAWRWTFLLRAQDIRYPIVPAQLAYFGSVFIGLLTPGRLGEFVKAIHVSRDCDVPAGTAFSGVLADRLFDLYALAIIGGLALISLGSVDGPVKAVVLSGSAVVLVIPLILLVNATSFSMTARSFGKLGRIGRKLFSPEGVAVQLRTGIMQITPRWIAIGIVFTTVAYIVFYGQAYLLSEALDLDVSFITVVYAVALGSLVTLVPISIAGLGTREAAIIAFLGNSGVSSEDALGFSFLVFVTFQLGSGAIGAVAWFLKPAPLSTNTTDS